MNDEHIDEEIRSAMNVMVRFRNTLFNIKILVPMNHPGGDLRYIWDEIKYVNRMGKMVYEKNKEKNKDSIL